MLGRCWEHSWQMFGILLGYLWEVFGIFLEYVYDMFKIFLRFWGTFLQNVGSLFLRFGRGVLLTFLFFSIFALFFVNPRFKFKHMSIFLIDWLVFADVHDIGHIRKYKGGIRPPAPTCIFLHFPKISLYILIESCRKQSNS